MDQSRAEQRAVAIAKLKRAASLPRMKDGRRPPMHVEAFSEGEKMQAEEHKEEEGAVVQNGESSVQLDLLSVDPPPSSAVATGELEEQEESTPPEPDPENEIEPEAEPDAEFEPSPAKKKRRSRSRSRSRGSKDLRSRPKAIPSPAPNNATLYANESSADEGRPQSPFIVPPQLISPVPSYFAQLPTAALSRSAESPFLYPGTSPSTPLPSLEALQRGLFRSNSTNMTHRMLAMHKLTGGTEPLESFTSPSPPPPLSAGRLNRNNTVTGGERSAARRLMLNRIGERLKETDAELTSGGEDAATPVSPRRRKRRSHSRRSASRASTVVDDRDLSSTTPNTPAVVPAPLGPSSLDNMPDPPRPPSSRSNHSLGLQVSTLDQNLDDVDTPTEEVKTPVQSTRPRRSVVVEDEDDHFSPPRPAFMGLPATPRRSQGVVRVAHTSDAPSTISSDSAVGVPVFLSGKTVSGVDLFPSSPFHTPLREKVSHDDDDEEVLYEPEIGATRWANRVTNDREVSWVAQSKSRPYTDIYDREISWAAEPVPESRMPIHDDEDDEDKEDEEPTWDERQPPDTLSSPADANYRVSTGSRELVVELDTSAEPTPSYLPPSPLATTALQISGTPSHSVRDESTSSPTCSPGDFFPPAPPSLPYPSHHHKELPDTPTHHIDLAGLEEAHITSKRSADGGMWDKFKRPFTRTGSISGRRSRTNSVSTRENRRDNTDSSVSRESGASQTSARLDKGENGVFAQQQAQPASVMQSPSASGSFLSLAPQAPPRNGVSPVPPASSADMAKYMDAKLFPFPGMKKLEEERNRARGMSASVSSPDIISPSFSQGLSVDQITPSSSSSSTQPARSPELAKDRKLYHQASDSRLISKFNGTLASPPISQAPSASSNHEYTKTTPARSLSHQPSSSKLPTTREGVKKWLKDKLVFSSQPTTSLPLNSAQYSPPAYEPKFAVATKPSISDLLRGRRENEFASDADDAAQSRTDSNTSTLQGQAIEAGYMTVNVRPLLTDPTKAVVRSGSGRDVPVFSTLSDLQSVSSPPDAPSTTPEPFSSVDEYPTRTTSESSSAFSSNAPSSPREEFNSQGAVVLERLDEMLGRGPRSPMWANVTDEPPRKLIQSSAVLQVANSNTVKDRFLFLFNDILVIAKPIMRDQDALRDPMSSAALDRKFIVKSVVQLQKLQFNADRDDPPLRGTLDANQPRHPIIRSFVYQFAKDPHQAIASLFDRLGTRDDAMALGQLLFRTLDLDRARLGEYLSQRTSKMVLKSYVDSFGFAGLRVDKALRAFLMSIHFPPKQSQVEYLVDAFASRWYEANAGIVAYSKDLAIRLVRAVVHLNEVLHGGISQEPGATQYPHRNVTSRDFMDAFRRTRSLLPDDLLERIYSSIRRERLCQSRNPASGTPDIPISTKRPLPSRLTYRVQSDPIIVRIPQPDPDLQITLHGQDLTFDPSVLNFSKLSEASFRVTGTSLGPKTIIMCRSGPNSLKYWGLPLGSTVMVERAFMRNTFQIAFMNHEREKRKYMFSVEDPVWRHQWISSLKHHIETARQAAQGNSDSSGPSKFHRATEKVALRVLQETLIGPSDPPTRPSTSNVDKALRGFVSSSSPQHMLNGGLSPGSLDSSRRSGLYSHARSKSRSQIYHKYGAGKFEIELGNESSSSALEQSQDEQDDDSTAKNSSIPLVLSFLQIGSPEAMSTRPPGDVWPVAAG
ncbi:hypothetical protein NEOLEDRAFT_1177372 [Neolentinus lepideus HHB14362 ss-1]|uniref:SEC7 domain-containing protein n=1 Tax=Neolentinus lepideus HHB14362 ss-1 TaxID=1314782 RepID=A0A165TK78_9AGAM|nr:hypothetical protein NEOLEDRAFT_1177372 [Neolentinus lepideus HHB14362 ss-1]